MSLKNTQQINKLIVGEILPRTTNNDIYPAGLVLITDANGKTMWSTVSSLSRSYAQFTSLSTNQGILTAESIDSVLQFREGNGMNIGIRDNQVFFQNTGILAIDVSGGNSLLGSNSSNSVINPRIKMVGTNSARLRADPGTNTLFFDVNTTNVANGPRYAFTSLLLKHNSTIAEPASFTRLDAPISESVLTLIGVDDLRLESVSETNRNVVYIRLSSIRSDQFANVSRIVNNEFPSVSTAIGTFVFRQENAAGSTRNSEFLPVSSLASRTSTTVGRLFTDFTSLSSQIRTNSTVIGRNFSTFSSLIRSINLRESLSLVALSTSEGILSSIYSGFLSTGQGQFSSLQGNTVTANKFFGDGSALTGLPTAVGGSGLAAFPPALSSATLSTSEGILSSIYAGFLSTGQGQFSSLQGNTVTANKFFGDGSALTGLPTAVGGSGSIALPPALSSATLSTSEGILSSIYAGFLSTGQGQFSSLRGNTVTANKFFGDGSALTGLPTAVGGSGLAALPPALSSATLSTSEGILSSIFTGFFSTGQGQFSSLRGNTVTANKFFGDGSALTGLPTAVGLAAFPPALSSATLSTSEGILSSIYAGFLSTGQGQFSSLRGNTVTANRFFGDGSALTGLPAGGGGSGSIALPPALSSVTLSTSEGRLSSIFTGFLSTGQGQFSSLRGNTVTANRFFGDGSALTGLPAGGGSGGSIALPPALSSATLSTSEGILSSIYTGFLSTGQGLFSSLRGNTVTANSLLIETYVTINGLLKADSLNIGEVSISDDEIKVGTTMTLNSTELNVGGATLNGSELNVGGAILGINGLILAGATLGDSELNVGGAMLGNLGLRAGGASIENNILNILTIQASNYLDAFGNSITLGGDGGYPTTGGTTALPPALSSATLSTSEGILSSIYTGFLSTGQGQFSSLRGNTVTANRFFGDGSALTGLPTAVGGSGLAALPPALSSATLSTSEGILSSIYVGFLSTGQGQFSSLRGNTVTANRFFGDGSALTGLPTAVGGSGLAALPPALSSATLSTSEGILSSIYTGFFSTGQGQFSSLRGNTVTANRFFGDGSALTGIAQFVLPPALSSATLSTSEGRLSSIYTGFFSTGQGQFSSLRGNTVTANRFFGDGSALTGIAQFVLPQALSSATLSTSEGILSSIYAGFFSTGQGQFSSLRGNTVTANKFFGDGSALTGIAQFVLPQALSSATLSTSEGILSSIYTGFFSTGQGQFSSLQGNTVTANSLKIETALTVNGLLMAGSVIAGGTTISNNEIIVGGGMTLKADGFNFGSVALTDLELNIGGAMLGTRGLIAGSGSICNGILRIFEIHATNYFDANGETSSGGGGGAGIVGDGTQTTSGSTAFPENLSSVTLSTSEGILSSIYTGFFSTGQGQFSSLQGNTVTAIKFFGDGSALTGLPAGGGGSSTALPPNLSSITLSTSEGRLSSIYAGFFSTGQGQFSSLRGNTVTANRFFGDGSALTGLPTAVGGSGSIAFPPALSSATLSTSEGILSSIYTGFLSTGQGHFSSLRGNTVTANRFFGDGSALTGLPSGGSGSGSGGLTAFPPALSSATLSTSEGRLSSIFTGFLSTGQGQFSSLRGNTVTANGFKFPDNSELKKYPSKPLGNTSWIQLNPNNTSHTISLLNRYYFVETTDFEYEIKIKYSNTLAPEQGEWFTVISHPFSTVPFTVEYLKGEDTPLVLELLYPAQATTFIYYLNNWIVHNTGVITIPLVTVT